MRAAQIENGIVVNFVEVLDYFGPFVDPKDAVFGSTINEDGTFNAPVVAPEDEEAKRVAAIKDVIAAIEASAPITPRLQREEVLIIRELIKAVSGSYPDTVGFNKAVAMEAEIVALRAQL